MFKECPKCKRKLEENDFNWKSKNIKRAYYCKVCSRAYVQNHYNKNQKYYSDKARKRDLSLKQKYREYTLRYLQLHPCVDCGESNIIVLEFDHINPKTKIDDISNMVKNGMSFSKIIEEIKKCEVRCSNCHKIRTARLNNSWRHKTRTDSSVG